MGSDMTTMQTKAQLALVAKSICDFADSTKSDQYQKFAAYTSSGYVKYLLDHYLF